MSGDGETTTVQEWTIEATIMRCGCGDPDSHRGMVCPRPRVEVVGELARGTTQRDEEQ